MHARLNMGWTFGTLHLSLFFLCGEKLIAGLASLL